ncbi:enoyl-CoA hydratase-related protein [uncultured Aquitalea sp.]|uniref:enoyl-CoA hydratase-related protein n=1 Tax=uncultured Aquitalea sp. TaxID=540272 RepID=UPI0025F04D29|nr:enoyl-CoA hydratase-related protein [uncultured Aquitalea sp.]
MNEPVLLNVSPQGVATVTLNRPELHNALDDKTVDLLQATLATLAEDNSVRVVILTGAGISFSAGHDGDWLKRMADFSPEQIERDARRLSGLLQTLDRLPHPTIARVQGSAFGIGAGLIACCDVAIAVSEALFAFSDVKLGVIPAISAPYVIRAIGERATRRYFVTAERLNAGKAKRLGLIHQTVENDELDDAVAHMARSLLLNGPQAMTAAKQLVQAIGQQPIGEKVIEQSIATIVALRSSEEGREGVNAFLEMRKPGWVR